MDFKVCYLGPVKCLHKKRQQRKEGGGGEGRGRKRCVKEGW